MEYVNENDECKQQQNNKYDANDEPCGYALGSGVLDNSNLNVIGHFGPANDLCALGELCVHCFNLRVVCNAVYDPSGSILSSGHEVCCFCLECSLIQIAGVTIGQYEVSLRVALNLVKNHVGALSNLESGQIGCVKNGVCGNSNSNVLVLNNNFLVTVNNNDNVGSRHLEGAVGYCNFANGSLAISGGVNLNDSGVTGLVSGGNSDDGVENSVGRVSGYLTVGVYVIVTSIKYTLKGKSVLVCNDICQSQAGQSNTISGGPNVAGNLAIDVKLESCETVILLPFTDVDLIGISYSNTVNFEVYSNLGCCIVYTEEVNVLAEVAYNSILVEPIPTVCSCVTLNVKILDACNKLSLLGIGVIVCNGILYGLVEVTVYIIVNVVNSRLNNVLGSNSLAGHVELEGSGGVLCTVNFGCNIFITGSTDHVQYYGNLFALCVPTFTANNIGVTIRNFVFVFQISFGSVLELILVNNGNGGEVRSVESNGFSYFINRNTLKFFGCTGS